MTQTATKSLAVSKSNEAGQRVLLGTIHFDDSNRATLSTEGSGPNVEKLKQDWEEISAKPELFWTKTVPGEFEGEKVKKLVEEPVKPGDPKYIYAVFDTLTRSYDYTVGFNK